MSILTQNEQNVYALTHYVYVFCLSRLLNKEECLVQQPGNTKPHIASLWRNRLARSAVNRKVGGSSPPRDELF